MDVSTKLAEERFSSGYYAALTTQVLKLGKGCLAEVEYDVDFVRTVEQWSGNYSYRYTLGGEFRINIFGQVAPLDAGTIIAAKGNFYAGKSGEQFRPLSDDAKVKDVLVLRVPFMSGNMLSTLFYNQVGSLNAIRDSDEQEEIAKGMDVGIRDWIRNAAGDDSSMKDHIILHMLPKYGNPDKSRQGVKRVTKRSIVDFTSDGESTVSSGTRDTPPHLGEPDVKPGAFYDPRLNDDCRGPFFNLVNNKLVQLDVRDQDDKLIAPWKFYDALKPGTLVLAECSLHCFLMKDKGSVRKVYQINAHSVRVLDDSDAKPVACVVPSVPGVDEAGVKKEASVSAASDAFTSFSVPKQRKLNSDASSSAVATGSTTVTKKSSTKERQRQKAKEKDDDLMQS